ncbi:sensor histidine kinase [Clostridium chauvoei]|uniref:histidine kinase n=3 Tax=Clostridium chauvoei TaxID=46867 RepID=A0A1U6IVI2_9CLOT|nr:HAMP domain-containing sensor histidine kinase [Clostridium chauvoei]MBX7280623.1 HAMP domain-containing histidine kinase [Clostridium chauvoei]MBX7283049.1 HAMP domain-containing histidine kinase [Clostridium chauvoei]MBX7285421.1 HAMP domain-containing histidine kinase [Clostridium chauvoei]MBX7288054.1 HAMP domain-containing histidine kinase [Clostridium chauvoei]MBX7290710.1 HAMP domain-containing histidine kinase [Clostridium chauvoei]
MKEKFKLYFKGVWGAEIVIAIILIIALLSGYNKALDGKLAKIGAGTFDALVNSDNYIKSMIYYESEDVSKHIYEVTNNLKDMSSIINENNYINENYIYNQKIYYVIIENETGRFTTNDVEFNNYILETNHSRFISKDILVEYINKHNLTSVIIDNKNTFNYYINDTNENISKKDLGRYTEIYYQSPTSYSYIVKTERITAQVMILATILTILLVIKILINLIFNRQNIHLEIKALSRLIYVLRYGFKYKATRNKILISLCGAAGVIVGYLYLVAGIRSQNVLVTFLTRYPFKGTLILVLIPLVCVLYSLKKSLDISVINDGLKKLNDGNLEYTLESYGEREVKELVDNINQIKDGYRIAVEEKVKNEKMKTELISNVSHDLKTPLTSIINYVNILKESNITEEERKDYLAILEKKSMKLKILIEDLFEVSKLNSGKMNINRELINIVSLVHQGLGEYSNLYEEKNITFKVNSNKEDILVNLDGKLMSRLFENIIINSLKYSLENTRVYIDILENNDDIEISFKNISNYEMEFSTQEIFERFVRADKSRTSLVEGSGIGLAIAKSIVELHNGDIKIEVEGDMFKLYIIIPK